MPTPLSASFRCHSRALAVLALLNGTAAASTSPELTMPAGAVATLQPGAVRVTGPLQRQLAPGAQVCVNAGSAGVSDGSVRRTLMVGQCYQVPAPRSLVSSLLSLAASWLPSSRKASTVNAESRGEGRCDDRAPGVALPSTSSLETLTVPVTSRPYPNTLEVISGSSERLLRLEQARPGSGFAVPLDALQNADHVDIRDGTGRLLYRGAVTHVIFPAIGGTEDFTPAAQAQRLLETGLIDYALPAYSLLVQAGERDAATQLLAIIRTCFVVPVPDTSGQN